MKSQSELSLEQECFQSKIKMLNFKFGTQLVKIILDQLQDHIIDQLQVRTLNFKINYF